MSDEYEARVTQITVGHKGDPIFAETATRISIDDEAGGEFVTVYQCHAKGEARILIDPQEWPMLRDSIDRLISECRS